MATVQENATAGFYQWAFIDKADKRVDNLFMMGDPWPLLVIVISYLYFVTKYGPNYMKNRKPFDLKTTIKVYNFVQILASVWMTHEMYKVFKDYNWTCQAVDYSNNETAVWTTRLIYVYLLAKLSELLDTVFFVLRKKDNQISFLHLYHHSSMPIITWGAVKWFGGGHGVFLPLINSFVHIIMYTYYFLSAFGPKVQKYLWWKKYMTTIQLIQFGMAFVHNLFLVFIDCGYPQYIAFLTVPNSVFFYFLFSDFYRKAYDKKEAEKASTTQNQVEAKKVE